VLLLERFYDPTAGQIMLDGIDLKEYNVRHLRSSFGYVGQVRCSYTVKT
jgi:ATP-binding cassette, subfamily B (MDR/TAP), member 1